MGNPQFNAWAELWQFPLSLISTKNSIGVDFKIRAVPVSGTQEIYRGDVFSKKKVLGLISVTNYFISSHINSTSDMLPLDNAPGGKYDVNQFGLDPNIITTNLPNFFQGYIQASTLQPQFCFVPTVSSLAISNPQSNLFTSICDNANCLNPSSVQDFYAPQQNELHISYTQNNTDWLLQRQDVNFACAKICPSTLSISGDNAICAVSNNYIISNLPLGASVQWQTIPQGVATINSPNSPQTTLTKNTNGTLTLMATITNACGNGQVTVSKANIIIGTPTPGPINWSWNTPPGRVLLSVDIVPTATSYKWYLDGTLKATTTNPTYQLPMSNVSCGNTYVFAVEAINSCSTSQQSYTSAEMPPCEGFAYMVAPNPGSDNIKVEASTSTLTKSNTTQSSEIQQIELLDKTGVVRQKQKFAKGTLTATVPVSSLPNDVYTLRIFDGQAWHSVKIIVKH